MVLILEILTGCVYDKEPENVPVDSDALTINLNLTVPASATGTRSYGHGQIAGTDDENYIMVENEYKDYQVLLFNKDGHLVEDKLSEIECVSNGNSGGKVSYTLTAKLSLPTQEDRDQMSKFKVMVLANWLSFERSNTQPNYNYPSFADYSVSGDTENIYKDGDNFNFTLKDQGDTWVPSVDKKQAIPMFGITEELDLQYVSDMSNFGDAPSFNVPMLRSLAKIEIVDMVPDGKSADIDKVILTKYNTSGRFIPDIQDPKNYQWSDKDFQIDAPSIPDGVSPRGMNLQFVKTQKTVRTEGATVDEEKDCFVAYIPEMDFEEVAENDYPVLDVTIGEGNSAKTYHIQLARYNNSKEPIEGSYYKSLLRNHIYRYNITNVGATAELDFVVETPWTTVEEDEWYYEDLKIGFVGGKEFKWTNISEENYPSFENEENGTGFEEDGLLNPKRTIIISQDNWVEGSFTLNSPSKGTWTMALYGDDNTPNDQFRIDIKKGNDWVEGNDTYTGKVGEDIIFRIIPVAANNNTEHSRARIVLTCTSFDNRMIEVNLPYYHFDINEIEMPKPSIDNNDYFYVKQYYSGFGEDDE